MSRRLVVALVAACMLIQPVDAGQSLSVGFGEADITPKIEPGKPVYIAGFGRDRKATGVHDPLMARTVVLSDGKEKIALVSIDLVGWFYPNIVDVRKRLPGFDYVLVSSTHNHEGPDTLGLWGEGMKSGVDPDYMEFVKQQVIASVKKAEKNLQLATATIGTARDPELLRDSREPYVKHDEIVVLKFAAANDKPLPVVARSQTAPQQEGAGKPIGILVQWNCHPETLGSDNTLISADYVGYTVNYLQEKHGCPIAYFTGTVGGLMTTLNIEIRDEDGNILPKDSYEMTERYGVLLGELADKALVSAQSCQLTPFDIRAKEFFLPMENVTFQTANLLGVLNRETQVWSGDPTKAKPATSADRGKPLALKSEIALLRFGELEVACIPGEIYPELVLDKVQDPVDPASDYPDAAIEPAIYKQMKGPYRMLFGLANDEIGYILPKRQWDAKPPFCYGRKKTQYGEINSIGPEAGPIICEAFKALAENPLRNEK